MFSVNLFDHLRPILTWRIRKSGLDKAKMNISVANSVLNAHIRCFHQLVARRRRKKQTMVVYGYISGFCWVNINNGNPFYHSDCVTAPNTVGGPVSSINMVKKEFSRVYLTQLYIWELWRVQLVFPVFAMAMLASERNIICCDNVFIYSLMPQSTI